MQHQLSKQGILWESDTCPCCLSDSETFNHMLSCPSEATTEFRNEKLSWLEENLKNIGAPPNKTEAIIHGISHWYLVQQGLKTSQHAPSFGFLNPDLVVIT